MVTGQEDLVRPPFAMVSLRLPLCMAWFDGSGQDHRDTCMGGWGFGYIDDEEFSSHKI